jgi:peroxiredoxin
MVRYRLIQLALASVLLGSLLWLLPVRQPGEDGGHHDTPDPALDLFERAGVTELTGGQRGRAFNLERFSGGRASLQDWTGSLVVLNFWATWCTPCTLEMPTLEALWQQYRERGLVVVGISVDAGGPRDVIGPYLSNLGLTFPVLLDPQMRTAHAWGVTGLPATFVIRPEGDVVGMAIGPREWDSAEMRALLDTLLPGVHGGSHAGPASPKGDNETRPAPRHWVPGRPQAPVPTMGAASFLVRGIRIVKVEP